MNLESILGLLGGGVGVFLLKAFADWRKAKQEDKQDAVGAWQQIANRESSRLEKLENRVQELEKMMLEKDQYINRLEQQLSSREIDLPG